MQSIISIISPFFIALICIEAYLSIRHHLNDYPVKDTIANILIFISSILIGLFLRGIAIMALLYLQQFSLFHIGTSIVAGIILFLISDLFHYFFHYMEHKSRLLWANHVVHHSCNSYNLSVGLRTTSINTVYRLFFEAPLCILGFDAGMIIVMHTIMISFAFFQHTALVKKLGWLEYFINTPSHHRVHHGSNEKYIDKNFGLVLIIWDKLFGTFQAEVEKPVYGLKKPITTHNPAKILLHEWIDMTKDIYKSRSWKERLNYLFGKPGWTPGTKRKPDITSNIKSPKPDTGKVPAALEIVR